MVRKIREEQEQRIRVDQICLKGKEDDLARRREQLSMREAAIKRQEQELKIQEAALKNKKDVAEPSLGHDRKGMLGTTLHPVEQCNRPSKLNSLRHVQRVRLVMY